MREMKDSGIPWIGEIPKGWKVMKLRNLGKFSASGIDKKVVEDEPLVRIINYVDIYKNTNKELWEQNYMVVSAPAEKCQEHQVNVGDMFFTPSSETIEDIGVSAVVMEELANTAFSYHIIRFQPTTDIDFNFRKYITNNTACLNYFSSCATGSIRKTISRDVFKECIVPLPPLAEQQRIAEFLDRKCAEVDEMIGLQEQIIEELKAYKQSVITEAVTKGLNPDAPMRDSGIEWIGQIPEHWEVHRLKSLFSSRVSGEWGDDAKQDERDRICLRIADFDYQRLRFKECESYTIRNYIKDDADLPYLAKGDILIEKSGGGEKTPVGRAVIYDLDLEQVMYANFMTRLRVKSHICPWFVKYILSAMYSNKAIYVYVKQTTGIQNLDLTAMLENEIVHLPSLTEQQAITDYLEEKCADIDSLIQTKLSKIDSLKEYKKSIIYEYVTGKREVTE